MPLGNRTHGQGEMEWDLVLFTRSLVILFFKLCTHNIKETFKNFSISVSPHQTVSPSTASHCMTGLFSTGHQQPNVQPTSPICAL